MQQRKPIAARRCRGGGSPTPVCCDGSPTLVSRKPIGRERGRRAAAPRGPPPAGPSGPAGSCSPRALQDPPAHLAAPALPARRRGRAGRGRSSVCGVCIGRARRARDPPSRIRRDGVVGRLGAAAAVRGPKGSLRPIMSLAIRAPLRLGAARGARRGRYGAAGGAARGTSRPASRGPELVLIVLRAGHGFKFG